MTEEEEEKESALSMRVRFMCQIYGDSAENLGKGFPNDEELMKYEKARYERARKETLEIAIGLSDAFYRDTALHSVLGMCMKASDLQFAAVIARALSTDLIRAKVIEEFSDYFVINKTDGKLHFSR
jgi:hypothetical protein